METFSIHTLKGLVSKPLATDPESLKIRPVPTGKFNTTFRVDGGKVSAILRIAPEENPADKLFYEHRMMLQEPGVLQKVKEMTSIPVPEVICLTERDPEIGRDWILMSLLPGSPMTGSIMPEEAIRRAHAEIGQALKSLHAITSRLFGYSGEHKPAEPQHDWPTAFSVIWDKLVDDIERVNGYDGEEAAAMRRLLESFHTSLPRLNRASLLHMDIWHENILVSEEGEVTGIVDWDRAMWGDPDLDLAIARYCGMTTSDFFIGYGQPGSRESEPVEVSPHHKLYLLYELQKYIFINRARRANPQAANNFKAQCLQLARSLF